MNKRTIITNTIELKVFLNNLSRSGSDRSDMMKKLSMEHIILTDDVKALLPTILSEIESSDSYKLAREIQKTSYIINFGSKNKIIYNIENRTFKKMANINNMLELVFNSPNVYINRMKFPLTVYNPRTLFGLSNDELEFNMWHPPAHWPPKKSEKPLHPIYEKFLRHLSGHVEESYEFLLDWMAISLQSRNLTYLTLAGTAGTGKGVFVKIMSHLHGIGELPNAVEVGYSNTINSQFNSEISNKTLVCLNEIHEASKAEITKLKDLNSNTMRLEAKGVDATIVANHASYILTTNNIRALNLEDSDRRFSIIDSPEQRLEQALTKEERDFVLKNDPDQIAELYNYLMHRKYKEVNVSYPYKGANARSIIFNGSDKWVIALVSHAAQSYAGIRVKHADISIILKKFNQRYEPTWRELKEVCKKFGNFKLIDTDIYLDSTFIDNPSPQNMIKHDSRRKCIEFVTKEEYKDLDEDKDLVVE